MQDDDDAEVQSQARTLQVQLKQSVDIMIQRSSSADVLAAWSMSGHALALKWHGSTKHTTSVAEVQSQARTGS
jgi:hypothetical protein